ncbi:MAG: Uma2 family endonuclease [Alphaproteobacteria bacterium]|nr:Uma2 family endonuclease [Alphaproteobacteria bacterium]
MDDVFAMQDAGILPPDHRCELIHGELIEMPSEGDKHSHAKAQLIMWFARTLPHDQYAVGPDTTFFLDKQEAPEPDVFLHAAALRPSQVGGRDALLVIEIAATSLVYDLSVKADLYHQYGVREYWVVDVEARQTHRHLPDGAGWTIAALAFDVPIALSQIPGVALRIADLV